MLLLLRHTHLEEEFSAFFHDLLDLQEASSVHEEELVPHRHAEAASVAEGQYLLEALGLHSWRELHYCRARIIAAATSVGATAVAEKVSEVRTASSQHSSMGLRRKSQTQSLCYKKRFLSFGWVGE